MAFLQNAINNTLAASSITGLTPVGTLLYANTSVPTGNTIANTASPTAFTSSYTIPANTLVGGEVLRLSLWGVLSTTGISVTLDIKVLFGGTTMVDTTAFSIAGGLSNDGWDGEIDFIVNSTGVSGTVEAQGVYTFSTNLTTNELISAPNTSPITINTTTSQSVTVQITWGTAATGNTITLREMILENLTTAAGPVGSVSNSDGSLTISPTSGNVVASINVANANTWTGVQQFGAAAITQTDALSIVSTAIATNAALGNYFYVTLASGATTMSLPTNPVDGQSITYELLQPASGSAGTVTWNAAFDFGTSGAPTLTVTNGKYDLVGFRYSSRKAAWLYLGSQLGF